MFFPAVAEQPFSTTTSYPIRKQKQQRANFGRGCLDRPLSWDTEIQGHGVRIWQNASHPIQVLEVGVIYVKVF